MLPIISRTDNECVTTGPGCVNDATFCFTLFTARRLQYCKNCTSFVDCTGSPFTSAIVNCPDGFFWDDVDKTCLASSKTCKECYKYCDETDWITEPPPEPTTEDDGPTTKVNPGGVTDDDDTTGRGVVDVTGESDDAGAVQLSAAGTLVGLLVLCGFYARMR